MNHIPRAWLRGDFVVTPTGRSGKVLRTGLTDGKVEISYLGREHDRCVIDPKLLKPWKATATRT